MLEKLQALAGAEHVYPDEPMKNHTTFRVGGCARWLVEPQSAQALWEVMDACRGDGVPFYVVGNGSNLLVSDGGYEGVILICSRICPAWRCRETRLRCRRGLFL